MNEKDRKTLLALQALLLKIKDLIDDFLKHYPKIEDPDDRNRL